MTGRRRSRRKCLYSDTTTGSRCQNYADSCPHIGHRRLVAGEAPTENRDRAEAAREAAAADHHHVTRTAENGRIPKQGEARALPRGLMTELSVQIVQDTNLSAAQVARDYWLHAGLFRLSQRRIGIGCGTGARTQSRPRRLFRSRLSRTPLHDVLFAGGTALVSQWDLSERFSEDIDLIVVSRDNPPGHTNTSEMSRLLADIFSDAVTDRATHDWEPSSHSPHPMLTQAYAARDGDSQYAKIDITESVADLSPWEWRPAMSMMGRYASDETLREFPELGGFSLPSLHFTITIGNKMRANIDNVDRGRHDRLRERARDLFDIASASADPDARTEIVAHMRQCAFNAETRNDPVGQRSQAVIRFPDSPALRKGTPEHDALRDGYRYVIDSLAWQPDRAPSFDDAVETARSLRPDD